jgi:hypothetical protein
VDLVEGLLEVGVVGFLAGVDGKALFFVGSVWGWIGEWVVVNRAGWFFVMIELIRIALSNDEFRGFVGFDFFELAELGAGEVFPLAGFGFFLQRQIPLITLGVEAGGQFLLKVRRIWAGAGGFDVLDRFAEHFGFINISNSGYNCQVLNALYNF